MAAWTSYIKKGETNKKHRNKTKHVSKNVKRVAREREKNIVTLYIIIK